MKNLLSLFLFIFFTFGSCQNSISEKKKEIATNKEKSGSVTVDGTKLTYNIEGKGNFDESRKRI